MKSLFATILFALSISAQGPTPPFNVRPGLEWIAPDPPLPGTRWYDYGWDSSSNGPVSPYEALAKDAQTRAPMRLAQGRPTPAPEPPTLPTPAARTSTSKSWVNSVSVSPYATVAFSDFDGDQQGGLGLNVGVGLSKAVSLVNFTEADDTDGPFVDRAGLGLRVTGRLTKAVSIFGQMSGGYSFSQSAGLGEDEWFIRPQFGATLDFWRWKAWHAGLTASWGLDVDLDGHTSQRLFGGLAIGTSF